MKSKPRAGKGTHLKVSSAPRRPRDFDESVSPADALDVLLRDRFHGAVNIQGIRFQLRYSVLRAVELAFAASRAGADHEASLHFEGLEDVDAEGGPNLRGLGAPLPNGREFVQVKTSTEPWGWHKLGKPLVGFIEILRTGAHDGRFLLVVNFRLQGDVALLARFSDLNPAEQAEIRRKFRRLCCKIGGTDREADELLELVRIQRVTEEELRAGVRSLLADLLGATDVDALDAYELVLSGQALGWAADRARIVGRDVSKLALSLRDGVLRSEHFSAISGRLVGTLPYASDALPEDFFEGKRVRFGHVVDGLDVRRPEWLRRIDEAFIGCPTVVIRAPSGHGKSTLAYRYALENWAQSATIVVRSAQSEEEVGALVDYLRSRSRLGLPVRVLVDADYITRAWPRVAAEVAALGGKTLVTVRMEDWNRFSVDALTRREIIEPSLQLTEAEHIYAAFRGRGRIHPAVDSAAWAFERLRPPHLLLEFVYFITHGQMLEERLRDQVSEFKRLGEDPGKIELLRIAAISNALGCWRG